MKTIWKFKLNPGQLDLSMPADSKLLSVQTQGGVPYVWALVDPDTDATNRRVYIAGTGHDIPPDVANDYAFVGTFQLMNGALVVHLFDGGEA